MLCELRRVEVGYLVGTIEGNGGIVDDFVSASCVQNSDKDGSDIFIHLYSVSEYFSVHEGNCPHRILLYFYFVCVVHFLYFRVGGQYELKGNNEVNEYSYDEGNQHKVQPCVGALEHNAMLLYIIIWV